MKSFFLNFKRWVKKIDIFLAPKIRYVILGLLIVAVLFLSEILYTLRNKPSYLLPFYLNQTRHAAQNSNIPKTLRNLERVSEMKLRELTKEYPQISLETQITTPPLPNNPALKEAYKTYLQSLDYEALVKSYSSKFAKPYYYLGLLAYRNNEPQLVVPFWQAAANLAPEWSYFHVELANFYLSRGLIDKAKETIDFCLKFKFPKEHCTQFLNENINTNTPEVTGYLKGEIENIK